MRLVPDPILRKQAIKIGKILPALKRLTSDMIETMHSLNGVGLAANQVGSLQKVAVIQTPDMEEPLVLVNPEITRREGEREVVEGCLSLPNVWERITRAAYIHMRGHDVSGNPLDVHADGLLAIVLQHAFDHLQGRLFIDRLSWLRRRRVGRPVHAAACG